MYVQSWPCFKVKKKKKRKNLVIWKCLFLVTLFQYVNDCEYMTDGHSCCSTEMKQSIVSSHLYPQFKYLTTTVYSPKWRLLALDI